MNMITDLFQQLRYPDCLFCHQKRQTEASWTALVYGDHSVLCGDCEEKLEPLSGELCATCSRPLAMLAPAYRKGHICYDCFRWEEDPEWKGVLRINESLFLYNEFLKEIISQYKFRGDYALANIFKRGINLKIKQLKPDLIVPIPLSKERLQERGFNQAEGILIEAGGLTFSSLLTRQHSEKQSKKARDERLLQENIFQWSSDQSITDKSVLILDDIYTTGATIRHAAKILKYYGAKEVLSLTIARG
ncbi:competence protein ComFC [Bacillus oleivorans]|uniref:Competence protein ComFC n=1 Tax=Bacillus oleivorans TaxID=1448271 RepID=A0A285CZF9_9BACI|nr:ComF family protein [Bacillus oleivorans]SNX72932.1 competence protein ComFC [Bacillus oleivorans]